MGFVSLMNFLCAALPFERDEIKKAQRRRYYASVSMNESIMMNVLITQRRRCCSFDSPGLASIVSYPGLMCCMGHNAIGVALF